MLSDEGLRDYVEQTIRDHPIKGPQALIAFDNLIQTLSDMTEVLREYERWEADLIMDPSAWAGDYPEFTPRLYSRWMILQGKRNAVLNFRP